MSLTKEEPLIQAPSKKKESVKPVQLVAQMPSKKKKIVAKIQTVLYKYFIEMTINTAGNRKEIGYIVEADSLDTAENLAKTRAVKEFANIRNIVKIKGKTLEFEEEYVKDLTEDLPEVTRINSEESSSTDNKITNPNVRDLLDNVSDDLKELTAWKVVFTPGRKPRKRDLDDFFVVLGASSETEARDQAKAKLAAKGIKAKDKWMNVIKTTTGELAKNHVTDDMLTKAEAAYNKAAETADTNLKFIDDEFSKPDIYRSYEVKNEQINENHVKITIEPKNIVIFERQSYKWFTEKFCLSDETIVEAKVLAKDAANAMIYTFIVLDKPTESNSCTLFDILCKDILTIYIVDETTGKTRTFDKLESELFLSAVKKGGTKQNECRSK